MRKPVGFTWFYTKMRIQNLFIFFISFMIILTGCSERPAKQKDKGGKSGPTDIYQIIFHLPGDDFASLGEIKVINRIKAQVESQGIGEVISTGSGMGTMTLIFKLHKDRSLDSVKDIIHEVYPNAAYRIEPEITEPLGNPEESGKHRGSP